MNPVARMLIAAAWVNVIGWTVIAAAWWLPRR